MEFQVEWSYLAWGMAAPKSGHKKRHRKDGVYEIGAPEGI